jgi:hypothetical protein
MATQDSDVSMFTVGDVVLVEDDAAVYLPRFYAFGIANLQMLWNSFAYPETNGASACGLDVCIAAEGITVVLDAHTGRLVPQVPRATELSQSVLQPFLPRSGVGTLLLPSAHAQLPASDVATYVPRRYADLAVVHPPLFQRGRTWVVTLSSAGSRHTLQLLDGPSADGCMSIGAFLGCMTGERTMSFWRLPPVH